MTINQSKAANKSLIHHPDLEWVNPKTLKKNPNNARIHSQKQRRALVAAIRKSKYLSPIVTDENGFVWAGHNRLNSALELGLKLVPVIRLTHLSEADKRAFALADNRIQETASWDMDLVQEEIQFLMDEGYDFESTGFELGDLDMMVGTAEPEVPDKEPRVDLPDPDTIAVSRTGDIWLIGNHILIVGDARDPQVYDLLFADGELASMVFADPPYNVKIAGNVSGLGKVQHGEFKFASGEMSEGEFVQFLRSTFRLCTRFSTNGSMFPVSDQ